MQHIPRFPLFLALTIANTAPAQTPETALAIAPDDATLAWGPCPAFLPPGCAIAVLHGDPAQPGVDVFLRVPAGAVLASHWHTSAERMVLVAGELRVAYDGQSPMTAHAGTYLFGPARAPHSAECRGTEACVLFIAFNEALDAVPAAEM